MEKICHIVSMIPKGKVCSYGAIADYAGLPGKARYVGYCLKRAPTSLELPWFRVVKSDGQLAFAKHTESSRKQQVLLLEEGIVVNNHRVKMNCYLWTPNLAEILIKLPY